MFGLSLIAALGTAFLAGPTLAGEIESGMALSVLARPVRRSAVLVGKWLGLVAFGSGFVVVAGLAQFLVVRATVGYWPPRRRSAGWRCSRRRRRCCSPWACCSPPSSRRWRRASWRSACSAPPGSRAWSAAVGEALGNEGVARVGTVSRMLLPTDGLWRGAMHAFQDPGLLAQFGDEFEGPPVPEPVAAHGHLPRLGRALDRPGARARGHGLPAPRPVSAAQLATRRLTRSNTAEGRIGSSSVSERAPRPTR